jgi:hypothetical protein
MYIEFPEYTPDLPDFQNPGTPRVKNVIPAGNSYQPFPAAVVYSNALTARCQGAVSTKDSSGNTVNFAGDATKLYKMTTASYADVSLAGGYTTATDDNWHFTRFNNFLIATNFADNPQKWTLGSSSAFSNLTTVVKARYCATIGNFLVLGNTFDAIDGNTPHRIRWSALDDPSDFTVSPTTQSDYQDLNATNGWVRQIVSGEYGVIFQERAISRMTYQGSPVVWDIQPVETGKGTNAPHSVVKVGNLIFYLGINGFYVFDGNQSVAIGVNKIDKTFYDDLDLSYQSRIYGTADFDKQIIYWLYPAAGNSSGRGNKILCFNYSSSATKRWTVIEDIDFELLYTSLSEGYTLDQLDAFGNMDTLAYSLDSRVWTGENFLLSGFNSSHKQINFTGAAMDAVIETSEAQLFPGNRADVSLVRPMIDGSGTVTMQIGTRNLLSDSVTWGTASSINSAGDCPVRSNARYHRARVNITGGFNDAQGIDIVKATKAGMR